MRGGLGGPLIITTGGIPLGGGPIGPGGPIPGGGGPPKLKKLLPISSGGGKAVKHMTFVKLSSPQNNHPIEILRFFEDI